MTYQLDNYVHDDDQPSRWQTPVIWSVLIAVAFIIYEITAQPVVSVALVCAKYGWNDWLTAFWLRRTDPDRGSGKACFWLYLASGLLKTAMMATVMMFAFAMVTGIRRAHQPMPAGQPPGPPAAFIMAFLTALMSFGLTFITSFRAFFLAWLHGVKLWLDPAVHRSRRKNLWPPRNPYAQGANKAGSILLTLLITGILPLLGWGLFAMVLHREALMGAKAAGGNPAAPMPMLVAVFTLILGGPVLILWLADILKRRLIANRPGECWRLDRIPEVVEIQEFDRVNADYPS